MPQSGTLWSRARVCLPASLVLSFLLCSVYLGHSPTCAVLCNCALTVHLPVRITRIPFHGFFATSVSVTPGAMSVKIFCPYSHWVFFCSRGLLSVFYLECKSSLRCVLHLSCPSLRLDLQLARPCVGREEAGFVGAGELCWCKIAASVSPPSFSAPSPGVERAPCGSEMKSP